MRKFNSLLAGVPVEFAKKQAINSKLIYSLKQFILREIVK